jgi:hypothetical protein
LRNGLELWNQRAIAKTACCLITITHLRSDP